MRNNQPIVNERYIFPADQTLISVTDLKGRITYCNTNFVTASGFTREELLGQPHNLVRHPDMPEEAFRDMWETIQGGNPWSGLVKNRRKNGTYYWVLANATPVRSGAQIVGYLSVRTAPSDADIAAAERLYAKMNEEAKAGSRKHVLLAGEVVRNTVLGRIAKISRMSLPVKMAAIQLAPVLLVLALDFTDWPLLYSYPLVLLFAIFSVYWAKKNVLSPLTHFLNDLNLVAAGDLTLNVSITEKGLFRKCQVALAQLVVSVRTVVRDARHEVANVRGASQEISAGNTDLSARTEDQAASLEETAASLEEITGTLRNTAQMAHDGEGLAKEAVETSQRTQAVVSELAETMKLISQSSKQIADILHVIEGVAFQTNILALNAAVEAARAGEQGRGFAVVAAEVRALAGRTTSAAKEVRELIAASTARVDNGARVTAQAQASMEEAVGSVAKTSAILQNIMQASKEQEMGISQINEAVARIDGITQQNAAMVEELAAAAKSLDHQVSFVHNTIRVFKLTAKDVTLAEEDAVALRKANAKALSYSDAGADQFH